MSLENKDIDDKKLLEEIDSLEPEYNVVKEKKEEPSSEPIETNKKRRYNITIVILLIVVILAYLCYDKIQKNPEIVESFLSNFRTEELHDIIDKYSSIEGYKDYDYDKELQEEENLKKEFQKNKEDIEISLYNSAFNELFMKLKNNSAYNFTDFSVYLIFYDVEGKIVDITCESIDYLDANGESCVKIFSEIKEYDKYEYLIKREYYNFFVEYKSVRDDISYDVSKDDMAIIIKGKNQSKKVVDQMQFLVEYYDKEENIIDIDVINVYDTKGNSGFELKAYPLSNLSEDGNGYSVKMLYAVQREY